MKYRPRMEQKALMLPKTLTDQLDEIATARGLSRAAVARDFLLRGLEDYRREQQMLEAIRRPMSGVA